VCGQPNSGKTSFVLDQLTRTKQKETPSGLFYKKFHKVFIFSPSTHTINKNIGVPEEQIIKEFDIAKLEEIVKEQEEDYAEVSESNKEILEFNKTASAKDKKDLETHQQILIVFDDMMTEISKDKSKIFMRMLMNRRHLCISVICITQVFNRIQPRLRKGFDIAIIFTTKNRKELESIREELTSFNPNEFQQLIDATLKDQHDFLLFKSYNDEVYRNLNLLDISEYPNEN
jgi:Fe2+ transport system protein B